MGVSLITGLLITGLDWTGILKFVFTDCGMQFPLSNYFDFLELPCSMICAGNQLHSYTRMMPGLLGITVRGSNLEFVTLKVDSLRMSQLAAVDALFAAVWVDCRLRPNNSVAI